MTLTAEETHIVALTLKAQAKRNLEIVGSTSIHAEMLEKVATALLRGEAVQRERRR